MPVLTRYLTFALLCCLSVAIARSQSLPAAERIAILHSGQDCSIRGMSIPANEIIWVSGSNGHVGRSLDGGRTWRWTTVAGFDSTDFRDIHAFDSATAVIMGIGNPAHILKTRDGGRSWTSVFTKEAPGMFLDAMDFRKGSGICIGDPVESDDGTKRFFIIRTRDSGDTWRQESSDRVPVPQHGEAVFSASGSNIALLDTKAYDYAFISGGLASRLYLIGHQGHPVSVYPLSIAAGTESTGAFSMATDAGKAFYCIGGDYREPGRTTALFTWTTDRGKRWHIPLAGAPSGYRSCVRIIHGRRLIACGTNGVDICNSPDSWTRISHESFNSCAVSPDRKRVFFGGAKGRIGVLLL